MKNVFTSLRNEHPSLGLQQDGNDKIMVTLSKYVYILIITYNIRVTSEMRDSFKKSISDVALFASKKVREVRNDAINEARKRINSEDIRHHAENMIRAAHDKASARVENLMKIKQNEVLTMKINA